MQTIAWSCSVGYVKNILRVFTPAITLKRAYESSVGHSYPYPELLKFCTTVIPIHTRNFCEFCKTPIP